MGSDGGQAPFKQKVLWTGTTFFLIPDDKISLIYKNTDETMFQCTLFGQFTNHITRDYMSYSKRKRGSGVWKKEVKIVFRNLEVLL